MVAGTRESKLVKIEGGISFQAVLCLDRSYRMSKIRCSD